MIQGKILDDTINWLINNQSIQPVKAGPGRKLNFTSDKNIVRPTFEYSHDDYRNGIGQVMVSAPAFSIKDSLSKIKALFTIGTKEFTIDSISDFSGFRVDILYKGKSYSTSLGNQENKTFEIKQVEFVPDDLEPLKYILARTKISLNCSLYDFGNNYVGEIKNLVMDADFKLDKE